MLDMLLKIGMNWAMLRSYMELERAGHRTVAERKAMLETKKRQLWQELEDIQSYIDFIERKEEIFDRILAEGRNEEKWGNEGKRRNEKRWGKRWKNVKKR